MNYTQELDMGLFWRAYSELERRFVEPDKLKNKEELVLGATKGLLESLRDPYTTIFSPRESEEIKKELEGRFEGVGMEIGIRKGILTVIAPIEGTPAFKAGLRPGDQILAINDEPTTDMSLEEAVGKIRGPKGTKVVLTVKRKGWENTKKIEIIRDTIVVPSIKLSEVEPGIYHLKITHFSSTLSLEFVKVVPKLLKARGIVLDLRYNPGGYLQSAVDIAGWFVERGEVVVVYKGRQEQRDLKASGTALLKDKNVVILINQGTASAAEILAGALRDNNKWLLVGEKSFGKGSVQEWVELGQGYALKVTTARWYTPRGDLIDGEGLEPDVSVEMTQKDWDEGKDPQLQKALQILKEKLETKNQ